MENNELTVEMIEDILLKFLSITQEKFGKDGFPLDSISKWLEFKNSSNHESPSKKNYKDASKSYYEQPKEISVTAPKSFEKNVNVPHHIKKMSSYENPSKTFYSEFKSLLKNVNDNTRFYENLIFNQGNENKPIKEETIDPLNYYKRKDLIKQTQFT